MLPVPWLARRWLPAFKEKPSAIRVPFFAELMQLPVNASGHMVYRIPAMLALLMWLMLIIAAARPVLYGEPVSVVSSGRDLMLAIDLSDSMRIDDMQIDNRFVTRMDAIKEVAGSFIQRRRGDRIGLILFGQRSYLQTPLTYDRRSVVVQLSEALPGFAGSSTAIGDAIGLSISTLRDRPAASRVLVLLTDGANTAGTDPAQAADIAVESDIRIHTVGVGAKSKRIIDVTGGEREIDPSRDLDEASLQYIAEKTGGRYFRAHDPQEMESIYAIIDELEPAPEEQMLRPQRTLYHWPLFLALLCCLLLLLTRDRVLA
ncbi:MAG: VWA domain-containing protein [Granulosicoccus sp.]